MLQVLWLMVPVSEQKACRLGGSMDGQRHHNSVVGHVRSEVCLCRALACRIWDGGFWFQALSRQGVRIAATFTEALGSL